MPAQISEDPSSDLEIIVVIPCYNESDLITSLQALEDCDPTAESVEVIVVLNSSERASDEVLEQNKQTKSDFDLWNNNRRLTYHLIEVPDLPKKHAGVGLARKIGMDEAVARFHKVQNDGVIVCFDADSKCSSNYLLDIANHFKAFPKTPGCSVHYEHPIEGDEFDKGIYQAIIDYELHLRYYNQSLKYCGLPYAFHTVGSSMAVRSSAYQKQGGMNKRKAGEDFYFLHKIIALGDFTELKTAKVIPSPRISDRVPFGTGKAVAEYINEHTCEYLTYAPASFREIKLFIDKLESFYNQDIQLNDLSDSFKEFIKGQNFEVKIQEIKSNTTDFESFKKRFFVWFDAFQVLKLVHYLRDEAYPNVGVKEALLALPSLKLSTVVTNDASKLLEEVRKIELA